MYTNLACRGQRFHKKPRRAMFTFKSKLMPIMTFQVVFLVVQIFIFYSCIVGETENASWKYSKTVNQDRGDLYAGKQYKPTWESLDARPLPQWYDDAKIGIFIHWGVFSVPGYVGVGTKGLAEWLWWYWKVDEFTEPVDPVQKAKFMKFKSRTAAAVDSVKKFMQSNYPPSWKYTDFAPQFTAEMFEPEKWAQIFNASGAKYVVLTSKHHDGFTLWGSRKSWNWNAVDNGPHRDLVGDLGAAVRDVGLHYGLYHSLYEWFHPIYNEDKKNNFTTQNFLKEKMTPELIELVTKYKPDILWSDGQFEAPCSYWNCTNFLAWLYNDSPVKDYVVTNDRWGTDVNCKHGDFLTCMDRYNPGEKQSKKWENCLTIDQESWGYRRNARLDDYFTMDELTLLLAQTVSYGGNFLMNIGPTPDGRIPPIYEERLKQFGDWLRVNGEAIYGSRMWHTPNDAFNKNVYYTMKNTAGQEVVFAIATTWPKNDQLVLGTPKPTSNAQVTWFGYKGDIKWREEKSQMVLELPKVSLSEIPCQYAWVFKLTGVN